MFPPKNIAYKCFEGIALFHVQTSTTSLAIVLRKATVGMAPLHRMGV